MQRHGDAEPLIAFRAVLVREKAEGDAAGCLHLLLEVHARDGYPLYLPRDVPAFLTPEYEAAGWVAEQDGRVLGHVALHRPSLDPTLAAARRATGLPAERLVLVSRLFVAPDLRRTGVGRGLLRHATEHARALGLRAVLDVGQTLAAPAALYESEGWTRVDALHLPLGQDRVLDLWVYVSPDAGRA